MEVVHGRLSDVQGQPNRPDNGRMNVQHLGKFQHFGTVTKPIIIAMNSSNKLTSVNGYNFCSR